VNIWACVPEKRQAWHVRGSCSHPDVNGGAYSVNNWSLGIELVNAQNKSDQFSDWQVNIAAQLVAYCFFKYPKLKTVVSHAALDPSRREDPSMLFPWRVFLERIDYFIFQHDWEGNSNEIQLRARNVDEIED